jgi:ABC-type molybdate transport system substrate-binding protein
MTWNKNTRQRMAATLLRGGRFLSRSILLSVVLVTGVMAADLEVFHADSLAGPMRALKKAFEAKHAGVTLNLTSGVSRDLARRILNGDACDIFASSSPAVIDEDLMNRKLAGAGKDAAMSEEIRNAATVPGTARNAKEATEFVGFLLSAEAQSILKEAGQPPVVPAIRKGAVPAAVH